MGAPDRNLLGCACAARRGGTWTRSGGRRGAAGLDLEPAPAAWSSGQTLMAFVELRIGQRRRPPPPLPSSARYRDPCGASPAGTPRLFLPARPGVPAAQAPWTRALFGQSGPPAHGPRKLPRQSLWEATGRARHACRPDGDQLPALGNPASRLSAETRGGSTPGPGGSERTAPRSALWQLPRFISRTPVFREGVSSLLITPSCLPHDGACQREHTMKSHRGAIIYLRSNNAVSLNRVRALTFRSLPNRN